MDTALLPPSPRCVCLTGVSLKASDIPQQWVVCSLSQSRRSSAAYATFFLPMDGESERARVTRSGHGRSELPHEAKLAARALVVVELRVGVALFMHRHKLRAETHQGEGPVVD